MVERHMRSSTLLQRPFSVSITFDRCRVAHSRQTLTLHTMGEYTPHSGDHSVDHSAFFGLLDHYARLLQVGDLGVRPLRSSIAELEVKNPPWTLDKCRDVFLQVSTTPPSTLDHVFFLFIQQKAHFRSATSRATIDRTGSTIENGFTCDHEGVIACGYQTKIWETIEESLRVDTVRQATVCPSERPSASQRNFDITKQCQPQQLVEVVDLEDFREALGCGSWWRGNRSTRSPGTPSLTPFP